MLKWLVLAGFVFLGIVGVRADESGVVMAAGDTLLVLRSKEFGLSAASRAEVINERLRLALGSPIKASDITVKATSRSRADVMLKGSLLVAVGVTEAKAHKANVLSLADVWAQRCRVILPKVSVGDDPFQK